mgnify:CR=1 FL=1
MPKKKIPAQHLVLLAPSVTSILLGTTLLTTSLSWMVFVGLCPLIAFCYASSSLSKKQIFWSMYVAGVIYFCFSFACILQTSPNRWTELDGAFATIVKILIWLLISLAMGSQFAMLGLCINRLKHAADRLISLLPVAWIGCELLRNYLFAFINYGPGASIGPNWNLGNLGATAAGTPLVFMARFVGLYGLSLAVVLINIAVYCFMKRDFRSGIAVLLPIALLTTIAWRSYQPSQKSISIAAIHFVSDEPIKSSDQLPKLAKPVDILVLPEYSRIFDTPDYSSYATTNLTKNGTIVTTVEAGSKPPTNQLTFYSQSTGFISKQDKTFLVAGGEYEPYLVQAIFFGLGRSYITKSFNDTQQIHRGYIAERPVRAPNVTIGALACSGVINISEYQRLTKAGAEVLANPASLSLLNSASSYHIQETYLTRFHAVANARPFVQASRSGQSFILSSDGRRLNSSGEELSAITHDVRAPKQRTVYSLFGELSSLLLAAVYLSALIWQSRLNRN